MISAMTVGCIYFYYVPAAELAGKLAAPARAGGAVCLYQEKITVAGSIFNSSWKFTNLHF